MIVTNKRCERCRNTFSKPVYCSLKKWQTTRFCSWDCLKLDSSLHTVKERNKLRQRKYRLKREFKITLEEYNKLFKKQLGRCALCGIHQSKLKTSLAVDHCHQTNKIRGLLCMNCNRGVGLLKDDASILQRAIVYLGVH